MYTFICMEVCTLCKNLTLCIMYLCMKYMYARVYVFMYVCFYIFQVCTCVCMHVCMYACMYVCVCMYVCKLCMYIICMYVCMYVGVGRGGALVETMTFNRRVVGSTPALAAT